MRRMILVLLVTALAFVAAPPPEARADAGDAIAGAIVGGIIGNAIARDQARKRTYTTKRTYSTSSVSSAQRAENRSVQNALNYFGFNAGGADGSIGPRTRAAISTYQAHLGYVPTGQLTQYEKDFLLTSHNRALAGGPATNQMIAANPMGTRGLLLVYRDQAAGLATGAAPVPSAPSVNVTVSPQMAAQPTAPAAQATTASAGDAATPQMPSFLGQAEARSLASHCNAVNLMTNAKGGFTTLDAMSDPTIALNEQFCLARTYAIAQSEKLASQVAGATPAQITQQCKQLAPLLREQVASISVNDRLAVTDKVSAFILTTGMPPAQVAQTARICLGDGYRVDDMEVALASALILVVLGEPAYSELLGHHLAEGFGASKRVDLAYGWYQASADALARGAVPVFAPQQQGRTELILTAASEIRGGATAQPAIGTGQPQATSPIPAFDIAQ
ncbi:peptidoglycan-binding domain-containing protein [Tropicimonas sp. IMCC6043]|uniref:peptidoglycan-binding domain-containing protein n=1 Tax=Tropicimonas sp. IMCC6043 TaxID=2510645 RepID=UPI00101CA393|nr:peptidoglycan-binding domain-containing protein [Tropicimonas sp. IMCC6043]RYH08137.1 peptidoglycan-binding protein [Tropicimonas sp. IMCC6043]